VIRGGRASADVVALDSRIARRPAAEPGTRPIRVVVADPVRLVRAGFGALLEGEADIAVAGEAGTVEELVTVASATHPDVVLMDVGLPGLAAPEATRRIVSAPRLSHVNVLIVGVADQDDQLLACLRAGASGCLLRDTEPGELVRSVRAVAAGEPVLPRGVVQHMLAELTSRPDPRLLRSSERLDELTAREREVMALVASGLSNDEIAEHLVVSRATAKTHVSRTLRKLHARDRAQLVTLAYETGLVLARPATALAV
jgi:DNA-binding NarL/FixJ family response regulator